VKGRETNREFNVIFMNVIIGAVLAVISVILIFLMIFTVIFLTKNSLNGIISAKEYSYFLIAGIGISIVLLVISIIFLSRNIKNITITGKTPETGTMVESEQGHEKAIEIDQIMKFLDSGEREIYELLLNAGGSLLQKNIMSVKGYSRASITRILDRLENKGLIQRVRHGSTNEIILKRISK
jgi:hypothetical protein